MTHKRSWLALGALLAAIIGGTVWAAEQEKQAPPACPRATPYDFGTCPAQGSPCCESACSTKEKETTCCEGKCCTDKKDKGCCADGKCCGCCDKAKQAVTLPVTPGSAVQVLVAPPTPGMAYDLPFAPPPLACVAMPPLSDRGWGSGWAATTVPQPTQPMQYTPVTQYVATPCAVPPPPAPACAPQPQCNPWKIWAVVEKDRTCLEMQVNAGGEETRAYSDNLVLKIGKESLKLTIVEKQVQVNGSFVKGSADTVTRNSADGSIFLEGHVKLKYEKAGQKAEVTAERVVVGVADGRLEVKPVEQSQVFTFWIGGGFR